MKIKQSLPMRTECKYERSDVLNPIKHYITLKKTEELKKNREIV